MRRINLAGHAFHDYLSLRLHREAVKLLRSNPELIATVQATLDRWMVTCSPNSRILLVAWQEIIDERAWELAVAKTQRAQQLRQASPLCTVLSQDVRLRILDEVRALRDGK